MAQWFGHVPQSEGSPVPFPVEAHAWVTVWWGEGGAHARGTDPCFSLT